SSAAFVGRCAEMGVLRCAFARAARGRGGLVMLSGAAGIGKTRLGREFAAEARLRGALVLRGDCYEKEWSPAYGPLAEALTTYVRSAAPAALRVDLGFAAGPIARFVPAVRERLPDVRDPLPVPPDEERFRFFDAGRQCPAAASRRRVVVLHLDDLQWAEPSTYALLRHVVRAAPEHRVLVVGAYRDREVDTDHPLRLQLAAMQRESI